MKAKKKKSSKSPVQELSVLTGRNISHVEDQVLQATEKVNHLIENLEPLSEKIQESKQLYQRFAKENAKPFELLSRKLKDLAKLQKILEATISKVDLSSFDDLQPLISFQSYIQKLTLRVNVEEIAHSLGNVRYADFSGLIIESELWDRMEYTQNSIKEMLSVSSITTDQRSLYTVEVDRRTSTAIDSPIVYQKLESYEAKLEIYDARTERTELKVDKLTESVNVQLDEFKRLFENPIQFIRLHSIKYTKTNSSFIINGEIIVRIRSKTLQDYICQILFSGKKKELTAEWHEMEIVNDLRLLMGPAEADSVNWKKIHEAVTSINEKIAMETTKKDVILMPRQEIVQLNPHYFA